MSNHDDLCGCRNSTIKTRAVSAENHLRLPQMSGPNFVLLEEHSACPAAALRLLQIHNQCLDCSGRKAFVVAASTSHQPGEIMALTITVTDQTTIGLIRLYRQYVREEDEIDGSFRDLAEGLVITFLDEHHRFREWRKANAMITRAG